MIYNERKNNMRKFMAEDFILSTETAVYLYENYAKNQPIIDYHCHINPREIAEDKVFSGITEAWLGGDHYKWRAIRACGYPEEMITGKESSDYEKFEAWAASMPKLIGNPLYHWTHLELKKYFDITTPLTPKTCKEIYEKCDSMMKSPEMSVKNIIKASNVETICTTDDPADSLEWHIEIAKDKNFKTKVLPAFRPDKGVNIDKAGFTDYLKVLGASENTTIDSIAKLLEVYKARLDFFGKMGCLTSDHGLDYLVYTPCTEAESDAILKKALAGEAVSQDEADAYKTFLLFFFAKEFKERGWVMQMHYGTTRNNSIVNFKKTGPDRGYDSIGAYDCIRNGLLFLGKLEEMDSLPKMIFYSLNPVENAAIDSMCGCFQENKEGIKSKIQHGSAWWFNDHLEGMRDQLKSFAATGVLGNFVGMLTDSRSFLSYTRHDYFRRILCDYIGNLIENGEYPYDLEEAGKMVADISYFNTKNYFGF